jgi:hypothetical protein
MTRHLLLAAMLAAAGCAPAATARPAPAPGPTTAAPAAARDLAPGVRHLRYLDASGPFAADVVEAAPGACGVALRSVKAGGQLAGRATTSELARGESARSGRPVLAAVNADFFSFTPPGVPVGAQVADGEVVRAGAERPAFGVDSAGRPFVLTPRISGEVRARAGWSAPLGAVNIRPAGDRLTLYNRFAGAQTPGDTGVVELRVRPLAAGESRDGAGVVVAVDTAAAGIELGGDVVLAGRGRGAVFLREIVAPGDTLAWTLGFEGVAGAVAELVGGHPVLLRGGQPAPELAATPASFGEARHPRTAVGWRADGTLLLVTVDGRQPEHSVGMSLAELAELMLRLGAVEALNLDGGGSTAMVVQGEVVNRPSDREGERAVANALLLLGPRAGECAAARPALSAPRRAPASRSSPR